MSELRDKLTKMLDDELRKPEVYKHVLRIASDERDYEKQEVIGNLKDFIVQSLDVDQPYLMGTDNVFKRMLLEVIDNGGINWNDIVDNYIHDAWEYYEND